MSLWGWEGFVYSLKKHSVKLFSLFSFLHLEASSGDKTHKTWLCWSWRDREQPEVFFFLWLRWLVLKKKNNKPSSLKPTKKILVVWGDGWTSQNSPHFSKAKLASAARPPARAARFKSPFTAGLCYFFVWQTVAVYLKSTRVVVRPLKSRTTLYKKMQRRLAVAPVSHRQLKNTKSKQYCRGPGSAKRRY